MMTAPDPALQVPRAHVAHWAWKKVRPLGDVTCRQYDADDLHPGFTERVYVQVDCRGHNEERAWQLSEQVRIALLALRYAEWDDGVIVDVERLGGRWLPDENGGPRYTSRWAITHHPHQVRQADG